MKIFEKSKFASFEIDLNLFSSQNEQQQERVVGQNSITIEWFSSKFKDLSRLSANIRSQMEQEYGFWEKKDLKYENLWTFECKGGKTYLTMENKSERLSLWIALA